VPDLEDIFVAAEQAGLETNADVNSGNPLGMGMGTVCIHNGRRLTASTAYLSEPPANLTILSNSGVGKILFDGKRAIGVQTLDGREFSVRKEIIVSGGAINTPQILILSGVGPKGELEQHQIPMIQELPQIGKNLQDHCFSSVGIVMKKDPKNIESQQSPTPMGWFKIRSILASLEFDELSEKSKTFLQRPFVPSIEIATVSSQRMDVC
jgi:choline dehydrogenase-like flavoprotein